MESILGGMIRAYRLRRGLSQTELSATMNWNPNPSRLSRYEQGRIVPRLSTLAKLSDALALAPDERGLLFREAGYAPTDAEVFQNLSVLQPFMDQWKGPAYLTDFSWRFLAWNKPLTKLFGFSPEQLVRLGQEKPTLLDLTFDPSWPIRRHIPEEYLVPFCRGQIARFKAQQRQRTGQRWYRKLLQRLMPIPLFKELWNTTAADLVSELMEYNRMHMDTPLGRLDFHMFASTVVSDPRLVVILWLPANATTSRLFS